jgi:hypothetical protein
MILQSRHLLVNGEQTKRFEQLELLMWQDESIPGMTTDLEGIAAYDTLLSHTLEATWKWIVYCDCGKSKIIPLLIYVRNCADFSGVPEM